MIEIRAAKRNDSRNIAELYNMSTAGVANYIWTKLAKPEEDILDAGERYHEKEDSVFSYKNCTIIEVDKIIAGMVMAYPMEASDIVDEDPVLAPFSRLEEDNSYFICGIALYPEYRGKGLGHQLAAQAKQQAIKKGLNKLSIVIFEDNEHVLGQYKKLGYQEVKREKIIQHPMIQHTGDAILMVNRLD
jgi:ribosomal protein S18 acetylase RimI-like enzyme